MGPDQKIEAAKNEFKHHTRLQFPSDLGAYGMLLNFTKYEYNRGLSSLIKTQPLNAGSIVLPLPQSLEDITNVRSGNAELGLTGAAALGLMNMNMSAESMKSSGAAVSKKLGDVLGNIGSTDMSDYLSTARTFSKFVGRNLLDSIAPGAGLAADITTGTAVNPHSTLEFEGVALKPHNFQWVLSPRNERESTSLNDIIRTIRRNILPQYQGLTDSNLFPRALLTYPNLVQITLLGVDQDYFYYYKPAMINGFNVQYTQGNGISLLKGGRPAVVTITMSMLEAEIHTAEDYSGRQNGGGR